MARLRHFAIVVRNLEKAAQFYESVFDLKRVGQEKLDFASAIYLSDGVINLALLNYVGKRGSGLDNAESFVGAHHFGFQVDDIAEAQKSIEAAAAHSSLISETIRKKRISSASSRIPTESSSIFRRRDGLARPAKAML